MPKDIRVVVTGFDATGKSVWSSDSLAKGKWGNEKLGQRLTDVWRVPKIPPDVHDDHAATAPGTPAEVFPPKGGLLLRVAEMPPDSVYRPHPELESNWFRMRGYDTIDLLVVISGEIWSYQEGTVKGVLLKQGDCFIQRGTNHTWRNTSDKPCMFAFVMVDATGRPKTADAH